MIVRILLFVFLLFSPFAFCKKEAIDTAYARVNAIQSPEKKAKAFNSLTELSWRYGNYNKGIFYGNAGLKVSEKYKLHKITGALLNNLGIIYDYKGKYPTALSHFFKALRIQEKINDQGGKAYTLNNIGLIYSNEKNFKDALHYQRRSLYIRKSINDQSGVSSSYNNIGIIYLLQEKHKLALNNFKQSLKIDQILKDTIPMMDGYNNIGICYMNMKQYDSALFYLTKTLELREHYKDLLGIAKAETNIGTVYEETGQFKKAKLAFERGLSIATEIGSIESMVYAHTHLEKIAVLEKDYKTAYTNSVKAVRLQDSISNISNTREETEIALKYKFDKENELKQIKQQRKDLLVQREQEKAKWFIVFLIVFVLLIAFFSYFLYKRWKIAKEQATIIESQKQLVLEKNTEILDSIAYAKRIQTAILPSESLRNELLPPHFIVYEPKDIVAGDFYWIEQLENWTLVAAADCTGHGVPGAMMSVVCHNALNRSVREFGLLHPGDILDKTRELIVQELSKSNEQVNDGMDISLCAWNKTTQQLHWSGANNPLWIIRQSGELEEIKPLKQPIGKYDDYTKFPTHELQYQSGDLLYLFTDGYSDQFGGETGKKFKSKNFKRLLESIASMEMDQQKSELLNMFHSWKGALEQVDDICIIGLKM